MPATHTSQKIALKTVTRIAILTAIASILMALDFPLPFTPPFYKFDFSDTVVLLGGFALGPVAGVTIEFLKSLINLLINGTTTAYIGEFASFVMGCSLILPATILYRYKKTFKSAVIGLILSTLSLTVVGSLLNYFVMIPAYSHFYHMEIEKIVNMGNAVNSLVKDLKTLIVFAVAPFNLVKGIASSVINLLLYKRLSKILYI